MHFSVIFVRITMKNNFNMGFIVILLISILACNQNNIPSNCQQKKTVTLTIDTNFTPSVFPQGYATFDLYTGQIKIDSRGATNNQGIFLPNSKAIFQVQNITENTPFILIGIATIPTGSNTGTAVDYMQTNEGAFLSLDPSEICHEKSLTFNFYSGLNGTLSCYVSSGGGCSCLNGIVNCSGSGPIVAIPSLSAKILPTVNASPPATQVCETRTTEICSPVYIGDKRNDACWFTWPWGADDCYFWCHDNGICYIPDFRIDCQNVSYPYCYDVYTY